MNTAETKQEMFRKAASIAAVTLFSGQAKGLIAFPAGLLTIGEIESKLGLMLDAFFAKVEEIDAADDRAAAIRAAAERIPG